MESQSAVTAGELCQSVSPIDSKRASICPSICPNNAVWASQIPGSALWLEGHPHTVTPLDSARKYTLKDSSVTNRL